MFIYNLCLTIGSSNATAFSIDAPSLIEKNDDKEKSYVNGKYLNYNTHYKLYMTSRKDEVRSFQS